MPDTSARPMLTSTPTQTFPSHLMTCVFNARKALCQTRGHGYARRAAGLHVCHGNCGNIARTDAEETGSPREQHADD